MSRVNRILSVAIVAAVMLVVGTGTAQAKPKPANPGIGIQSSACASGNFCVWYWGGFAEPPADWHWAGNDGDWSNNDHEGYDISYNDMSWANNGTACGGCDHVRIYSSTTQNSSTLTLCIHRGQWLSWDSGAVTYYAANSGRSHRWGGECGSSEPHIPF